MAEFLYVFLRNDGTCIPFETKQPPAPAPFKPYATMQAPVATLQDPTRQPPYPANEELPALLAEGWRPLRETGLGDGTAILVLERQS